MRYNVCMDKIVVGFDGTASAKKAADEAAAFALAMGADLHVVTVVTDDPGKHGMDIEVMEGEPVKAVDERSAGLRKRAAEIASQLDGAYEGLTVVPTVIVGPAARSIVDYAKKDRRGCHRRRQPESPGPQSGSGFDRGGHSSRRSVPGVHRQDDDLSLLWWITRRLSRLWRPGPVE